MATKQSDDARNGAQPPEALAIVAPKDVVMECDRLAALLRAAHGALCEGGEDNRADVLSLLEIAHERVDTVRDAIERGTDDGAFNWPAAEVASLIDGARKA